MKKAYSNTKIKKYTLPKAYNAKLPLSKKKIDDLQAMVRKGLIPGDHHSFYEQITNN